MQVASRTSRRDATHRYVTPAMKNTTRNTRPTSSKPSNVPSISDSSPKKTVDTSAVKSNKPLTLKKFVDRFRYDEPQSRPERDSINSDFWWLHDELKNTSRLDEDDDEHKSNLPEFIEIFPSTDIDQDLNKRASLLLNQTFSAHSSDTGHISSTGIGSTMTSTFQAPSIYHEQPARPIFTRIDNSRVQFRSDGTDEDILYQWRLRRRLEQAQHGEPITFPSKVTNRSPARSIFPTLPIEIPNIIPPPPVVQPPSPKRERHQSSSTTNTESAITPVPIRQYSESSTQTLQDACIQTSLTLSTTSMVVPNEADLHPTRDYDDHHSSVWHRPPVRSKYETTRVSSSSSPSPIKRHHHHHTFRPVVLTGQSTVINNLSPRHHPSNPMQSSQESTLTQVTSIMTIDNNRQEIRNNNSIAIIDEFQEPIQDDNHIDDDILNMLKQKRDELLIQFRDIEQCLANMSS